MKSKIIAAAAAATIALAGFCAMPVSAQTTDADALSKAREVGNTKRAERKFYDADRFDLSGLPVYRPEERVSGTLRQWGNNYPKDSGLMAVWEAEFRRHHPGIVFEDNLHSSAVGIPGLITGAADLAPMGRQALWDELKGLERAGAGDSKSETEVVEIVMATGSYNVRGWTFALGIFVNDANPIQGLTMEQLDGILGAQRDGGWDGLTWDTSVARGPEQNIRTWGEAGVTGPLADESIVIYGYNAKYHFNDEIDKKVLKGSGKWNETMRAYSNMAGLKADGSLTAGGELMMNGVRANPAGIAYTGVPFQQPGTRPLPLSTDGGKTYIPLTLETVQNRTYPLIRDVYFYFLRENGKPIDPKVREFLRYVLSRDGQAAISADGKYLPLTAEVAAEQLRKLQ